MYPKMLQLPDGTQHRARNENEEASLRAAGYKEKPSATKVPVVVSEAPKEQNESLEEMTKIELLQYADQQGIKVNQYGNKPEILAAIQAAQGGS